MKIVLLPLLLLSHLLHAQSLKVSNPFGEFGLLNGGKSIYTRTDSLEEGSYWFPSEPVRANIHLKTGRDYFNIKALLNLKDNELSFLDSTGQLLTATESVLVVQFYDSIASKGYVFKTGFPPIDGLTENTFYQVLAEGNLTLLKSFKISYVDNTPIGRSANVRKYMTDEVFYVNSNKTMQKIKKRKKDITSFFKDKEAKLENYIEENKINFNSEADIVAVFKFYNTLL